MSLPFENIDDSEEIAREDAAEENSPQPNNRIFIIIAAVLGGIILLALLCFAVYALLLQPRQRQHGQAGHQQASRGNLIRAERSRPAYQDGAGGEEKNGQRDQEQALTLFGHAATPASPEALGQGQLPHAPRADAALLRQ